MCKRGVRACARARVHMRGVRVWRVTVCKRGVRVCVRARVYARGQGVEGRQCVPTRACAGSVYGVRACTRGARVRDDLLIPLVRNPLTHTHTHTHQFADLNPELTPFQRRFVSSVKRCDELERKIRFFAAEIDKFGLPRTSETTVDQVRVSVSVCVSVCVCERERDAQRWGRGA